MGLEDIDVERIIGAIFGCNIVLAQEKIFEANRAAVEVGISNPAPQ